LPDETLLDIVVETRELARARMARPAELPDTFDAWLPTGLLPVTGSTGIFLGPTHVIGGVG
jgi:hypothetical protein